MVPVIRISDSTYRLLQKHAVPFEDSQASVVDKMAKFYDAHHEKVSGSSHTSHGDNEHIPDLRFTKVLDAHFDGVKVKNWNRLLKEALIQAWRHSSGFSEMRRMTSANIVRGERTDCGYEYIPEIDVSFQGVDSGSAWRLSKEIAQKLKIPVEVEFIWRDKEGAENPGENGRVAWNNQ